MFLLIRVVRIYRSISKAFCVYESVCCKLQAYKIFAIKPDKTSYTIVDYRKIKLKLKKGKEKKRNANVKGGQIMNCQFHYLYIPWHEIYKRNIYSSQLS